MRLFAQFKNLLIVVLLGAAVLAASTSNFKDAAVITAVVILNALFSFYQEYRAEQSVGALRKMLAHSAAVRRAAQIALVSAEQLVQGDVVIVEAGSRAPADGRLLVSERLEVDESVLTGESQPVAKEAKRCMAEATPLADQQNMIFMNTVVTRGRGELVVTATGMNTAMGQLSAELASTSEPPTPLQTQLDRLAKRLAALAAVLVGALLVLELLRGQSLTHVALESIALAVAAMPEGLPAVVTVTLALGMRRLAKQRAIVKRLASVETLGCTTVICTDKTGTLTVNQMTAREIVVGGTRLLVTGEGYSQDGEIRTRTGTLSTLDLTPFLRAMVLCNDSQVKDGKVIGDPMEGALLVLAAKGGMSRDDQVRAFPRIAEIPFDARHKFMATFHSAGDDIHVFVKGAPDVVTGRCSAISGAQVDNAASWGSTETIRLAKQGLRVLAIASRSIALTGFDARTVLDDQINDLTLVGLVGLLDPPRAEAKDAIAQCREAGVKVKMITGDHAETAIAIARELGLEGRAISGAELDQLADAALPDAVDEADVFTRLTPEKKVQIVRALRRRGHVVAMTGDGVNDAPALKTADIGVAMGNAGTEVAKEAADMVLVDDNFATIVGAIKEGRGLYANIVKFVRFQLSTAVGAILVVFSAPFLGLPDPFNPIQILWVAMIMDGPPAVALGLDPARPEVMLEPPRSSRESLLTLPRAIHLLCFGVIMMTGTLAVLAYDLPLSGKQHALTLAFTTFVFFQIFNVFNVRTERVSALGGALFSNTALWLSLLAVSLLQVTAVHWGPAAGIFQMVPLSISDWVTAVAVSSTIFLFEEVRKFVVRVARAARQ